MVTIPEIFPEPAVLCALEPDELGVRMLPALVSWRGTYPGTPMSVDAMVQKLQSREFHGNSGAYPGHPRHEVETAIREAWAWLEGAALLIRDPGFISPDTIRILSRKARLLAQQTDPTKVLSHRKLPKESLHPAIREDVWSLYHRGKYDTAVFESMKAVEVAVCEASMLGHELIGVALMRKAFDAQSGPLTDHKTEKGERDARSALFAGAIGSYKNPHSHRFVALADPDEAAEIVLLANHLLRIIDSRRTNK